MTRDPFETISRDFFLVSILFDVPDCGSRALTGRTTTTTEEVARGTKKWIRVSASISRGRRRCCTVVRRWSSCCATARSLGYRWKRSLMDQEPPARHCCVGTLRTGLIGILSGSSPIYNREARSRRQVDRRRRNFSYAQAQEPLVVFLFAVEQERDP
jgi:hypothetical protein